MDEILDRNEVLNLLDRLGSDQDGEVLAAAREVHAQITAAGADWDDLLAPELSPRRAGSDMPDTEHAGAAPPLSGNRKAADSLTLIEELLARRNCSDALREELAEYKADIAEGAFEARDHEYVRALHRRLTK